MMAAPPDSPVPTTLTRARRGQRIAVALGLLLPGCYSGFDHADADPEDAPGSTSGDGDGGSSSGGDDDGEPNFGECKSEALMRSTLRRLNLREYRNTVRDLLQLEVLPEFTLPLDAVNTLGFDNDGDALTLSLDGAERYYDAAITLSDALAEAGTPPMAECAEATEDALHPCLNDAVEGWLYRALRGPVSEASRLRAVAAMTEETTHAGAARAVLLFTLTSPEFLFHRKRFEDVAPDDEEADFEVADRLAYLLWSSTPDQVLLDAAAAGELREEHAVRLQVERMLAAPHASRFYADFVAQWLELGQLDGKPDATENPELAADMRTETLRLFEAVGRDGESADALLLQSEATISGRLAAHYGIDTDLGLDEWSSVAMPAGERAGLLTHASVLAALGGDTFSDPIHRGALVGATFGNESVPVLTEEPPELPQFEEEVTMRELLEIHTADPVCAACHKLMDPYGLALENYDRFGRYRTSYANGLAIDPSGELVGGLAFADTPELAQVLVDSGKFTDAIAQHLAVYGAARTLSVEERCFEQRVLQHSKDTQRSLAEMITEFAVSPLVTSTGTTP